jgi:hypothetical protein
MSEPDESQLPVEFEISPAEANYWWSKNQPTGTLLNRLMLAFVVGPIVLVFKNYYLLSLVVFSLMIPYGFLVRRLAVSAVRAYLANHPDSVLEFREAGIIL